MEGENAVRHEAELRDLYRAKFGRQVDRIEALPRSGSDRQYFRLWSGDETVIGAYNPDIKENTAFFGFSQHFRSLDLPVPEVYAANMARTLYLQQDLGDLTLLQHLQAKRNDDAVPASVLQLYRQALTALARLQIEGGQSLDYSLCYPRAAFDKQSMLWDLSYFKYYFLKLAHVPFDEQLLEDDFHALADYLLGTETHFFLFRDFQARNIMLHEGQPWFIDYQGGRRGALQYDVASLLYQAKAAIPHATRMELLDHYWQEVQGKVAASERVFREYFFGYVLIRCIQVLGAYGYRGFYERKAHFLESIPFALENIAWLLENVKLPVELPHLWEVLDRMVKAKSLQALARKWDQKSPLTVRIHSFSYKRGLPEDPSGNGGGFIFDCRALHNPGRYEPYKKLTGRDAPVIEFLRQNSRIDSFLQDVFSIVEPAVQRYIERDFTHLMVSFGCTGGQHRSVYSADRLAEMLEKKYNIRVELEHIEQERKGWKN